jgi:hypothetical protein
MVHEKPAMVSRVPENHCRRIVFRTDGLLLPAAVYPAFAG